MNNPSLGEFVKHPYFRIVCLGKALGQRKWKRRPQPEFNLDQDGQMQWAFFIDIWSCQELQLCFSNFKEFCIVLVLLYDCWIVFSVWVSSDRNLQTETWMCLSFRICTIDQVCKKTCEKKRPKISEWSGILGTEPIVACHVAMLLCQYPVWFGDSALLWRYHVTPWYFCAVNPEEDGKSPQLSRENCSPPMPNPDLLAGKMSLSKHEIRKKSKQKIWWQRWKLRLAWAWRCTNERPDVGSYWPLDAIAVDMIWCRTSCTCQRVIWRLWLPERPAMVARRSSGVVYCKELPVGIFRNSPEFSIMSPKNWNYIVLAERSQADSIGLESERWFNFSHLCISTVPSPVVAKKCSDESPFLPLIL